MDFDSVRIDHIVRTEDDSEAVEEMPEVYRLAELAAVLHILVSVQVVVGTDLLEDKNHFATRKDHLVVRMTQNE